VKTPPLPDTDLANFAVLSADHRRGALEHFRLSRPPYRYVPLRKSVPDILNVRAGFLGALPRTPYEKIAEVIRNEAWSPEEADANLRVAEGLYQHAELHKLSGRRHDFFPMPIGTDHKVVYWQSLVLDVGGRALVPFFDPRRLASRLTAQGRRFVFSMMHERVRAADPDFADVALGIFQFSVPKVGQRVPTLFTDHGVQLFTFEELDRMVRDTYLAWQEVCEERAATARRAVGGAGGMFG
jgi:hypothetical protein